MRQIKRSALLALTLVTFDQAVGSRLSPPNLWRLRGGADGDSEDAPPPRPPNKALSREEILDKLNAIPTFCIMNDESGVVAMRDAESGKAACCWFTDGTEARALLKATREQNPDATLRLACHGLGAAFTQCNGWPSADGKVDPHTAENGEEVELRLQGTHGLVSGVAPQLKELLKQNNIDEGCWTLPVFMCDELQSRSIVPVFLHPAELSMAWKKSGRKDEDMPKNLTVMDMRMLVAQMQLDTNPWDLVHFVTSKDSIELAQEVMGGSKDDAVDDVADDVAEDDDDFGVDDDDGVDV